MASLQDFLRQYEAELNTQASQQPQIDLSRFNAIPPATQPAKDVGGFVAAGKRAVGAGLQGVGQLAADFVPGVGQDNALTAYGKGVVDANAPAIRSLSDIADRPGMALKEATGNVAGSVGTALGLRALGQGITAASPLTGLFAPVTAAVGQGISWGSPILAGMLPSFGGIREQQIAKDAGAATSTGEKLTALGGATAVGALEKFGPEGWATAALNKDARKALVGKFSGANVLQRMGMAGAKGAAIEGTTEMVQNPIEQWASGDNPLTPAALKDTLFAGAMGAIGGGTVGSVFGMVRDKPAGAVTNDDLKGATDEQLAPPAPTEPLQAEYEQAQREFEVANQPQNNQYPGLAETSVDELQRMSELLGSKEGQAIAGAKEIKAAIAAELQARARAAEPTLEQRNDRDIAAAFAEPVAAPEVDPLIAAETRAQREYALANRPKDERYPGLAESSDEDLQRMAAVLKSKQGQKVANRKDVQAAIAQEIAFRAQQAMPTQAQQADRVIEANVSAMTEPHNIPVPDRVRAVSAGQDLFGNVTPQAENLSTSAATPSAATLVAQLPKTLKGQERARLATAPVEDLPNRLYSLWEKKGGFGSRSAYVENVGALYNQITGGQIQDHPNAMAQQASAVMQGFQEAPTQGRIENVQGSLKAVPRLTKQEQRRVMDATMASVEAGQSPAAALGTNIPAPVVANETPVDAPQAVLSRTDATQELVAQGEANVTSPSVVEQGSKGASDNAPAGARAGAAEQGNARGRVRGRTRAPEASNSSPVAVGAAPAEQAASVAPEADEVSPFAEPETRDLELKKYKEAYLGLTKPEKMSLSAFTKKKAEYLQAIAEMERNADSSGSKKGAKKFLEEQARFDPEAVKMARRKAADATKWVEHSKDKLDERNARIAEKEAAWEQMLSEMDDTQKRKQTRTDKQLEKAFKGQASGTDATPLNPNVHTLRSLAEELVKTFGEDMRSAIMAGRVKLVTNQMHLAADTGDMSRRGQITQGMYYYNSKAPAGTGTVYFVAGNLAKTQQGYTAFDVALHEIGEHAGMEQMLGKQVYSQLMSSIRKAMAVQTPKSQFEKDVAAAKKKLLGDQQGQPHEVLAYMIQHTPDSTGLQKMWAAIKVFAARFGLLPDSMKDAATMRALAEGATAKWLSGVAGQTSARGVTGAASGINNPEMRTVFTNYGEAAQAAKGVLGKVEALKAVDWKGTNLKTFRTMASWITKHHMVQMFDKWFNGALAKNAEADTIQQAMSARTAQLFNEPHNRFKALTPTMQAKIAQLMELTEMKLDPRKMWDAHTHLQGLKGTELAQAKEYHNKGRQWWGQLSAEAQGVYNDLAAMNEALYTMELAVSTYNMVHANAGPAKDLPEFRAPPTEKFLQSGAVHGSIEAAHTYWKDVLAGYTAQLDKYVAEQRGLLPAKGETDPAVVAAERKMLKGVQDEKVRRTIRAQLRTRTDALTEDQKRIVRHLSPLEAQLRMAGETTEAFKHAPYFHLGRFGDYFVSFRVRTDKDGQADPVAMTHVQQQLAKEFPDVAIRSDATDPHVYARFESLDQSSVFWDRAHELQKEGWLMPVGVKDTGKKDPGEILRGTKQELISGYRTAGPNWLSRVVESIQAEGFDDEVTKQMVAHVRSMYLDALPDTAAIKVKQKREGHPGWHKDMMRSYAHRMRVGSNKVASLAAEPTRTQSFSEMNDAVAQAGTDTKISNLQQNKMVALVDELQKRDSNQMSVPHTPGVDMLRAINHAYFLGMSPSYLLIQMTQLGVLTWPELAKKHGFVKAAKAIGEVSGIALKVVKTVLSEGYARQGLKGVADMVITGDMLERAGLAKGDAEFLVKIMAAGKLDIGNAARNVGRVAEGETGSEALKIATAMGYASEILTRTITALAAKRLHKGKAEELVPYAISVVDESMMDYSTSNEGRMMGKQGVAGVASTVMFSFMKYQAQLLEKLYREVYTAYGKDATDAQKAEARKFLGGHLMALMALAGSLGLPFATAVAAAADGLCSMFGDGHCDSKIAMRNMTAEVFGHDIEPLLSTGIASRALGFNVSERAGEGNILPFSKFLADKRAMEDRLKSLAMDSWGAPTAMIGNALKANEKFWQGDLLGSMQEAVPSALKGPVKAYEMSEKGYTDKAGNVLPMTPGAYDIFLQAVGLNPGEKADYQQAKFAQSQRSGVLGREATRIRTKLASAIEQNNTDAMQTWLEKARAYDAENVGSRAILPEMGSVLQQRARARAMATAQGSPLGVSPKDITAQRFTSFYRAE